MKDAIVVISGGGGYVGSAVVRVLQSNGMKVIVARRPVRPDVENKQDKVLEEGVITYFCDLANRNSIVEMFEDVERDHGPIYAVVHAAGVAPNRKSSLKITEDDMRSQFEENTMPAFNFLQEGARVLQKNQRGVLVGVTTKGVVVPEATRSLGAYVAAKYAVQGLLVLLCEAVAAAGVRVYSVAPGFMDGGMNDALPRAFVDLVKHKNGMLVTSDEVANVIMHLLGDETVTAPLTTIVDV